MAEGDGLEEGLAFLGLLAHGGELRENAPAAVDLIAQQAEILGDGRRCGGAELPVEFLRHHHDGAERRAEFVRGRCGEAVELRQVLLAG